jgi:hypothetical protein
MFLATYLSLCGFCSRIITMEVEPEVGAEQLIEEPMFGVLDVVLLVSLLGLGGWWLLKSRRQPGVSSTDKSYFMQ